MKLTATKMDVIIALEHAAEEERTNCEKFCALCSEEVARERREKSAMFLAGIQSALYHIEKEAFRA